MPAPKGTRPPNAGKGRPKGSKNKIPAQIREGFALLIAGNQAELDGWLKRASKKQPAVALGLVADIAEFVIPKLARTDIKADVKGAIQVVISPTDAKL